MRPYPVRGGVAVVTGAASGIGRALGVELAARGSHLALIDRDAAGLEAVTSELRARHPDVRVSAHLFDLAHPDSIADLTDAVLRAQRRVTLLINNAGVALGGHFTELTLEEFEWVMSVNFRAVVAMTGAFLPALRCSLDAHVVNVSSVFGLVAPAGQSAYAASKYAVRGFSEALRHELAPRGVGVTVVHPGGIRTAIARNARTASGTDPAQAERGRREIEKVLRMDPAQAARTILNAAERRQGRVLVGHDAALLDVVARLLPGRYWQVLGPLFERGS
ncbi:short-subunit dehydrogenase [Deinobacterium chartae]|uniref:Short-subunit dehydrogenase n=1 Tax=Deinobacterium chartae TaxID=521158 RepID=A0A841HVH6_9DEIO|nr:short-subunit dehydrogenase [Deinobacterium chartae]